MSSSARQIKANRRNAQLCTGPTTEAGKQACKMNALRHGLTSTQVVLPYEDPQAFDLLLADYFAGHSPSGPTEEALVHELAGAWWRLVRARRVQSEFLACTLDNSGDLSVVCVLTGNDSPAYAKIERYVNAAERSWHKALRILQQTQSLRRKLAAQSRPAASLPESDRRPPSLCGCSLEAQALPPASPRVAPPPPSPLTPAPIPPIGSVSRIPRQAVTLNSYAVPEPSEPPAVRCRTHAD